VNLSALVFKLKILRGVKMLKKFTSNNRTQAFITLGLVIAIGLIINVLANQFTTHIDLTGDKRFTVTEPTKKLVRDLDDVVFVRILLQGKFPADVKRLQTASRDMLQEFKSLNPNVDFKFEDPNVGGSTEERKKRFEQMKEEGLVPMRFRVVDDKEKTEQYIFPYAEFNYRNRRVVVKLLENDVPGMNPTAALNNSIALLEYKFANAIQKLLNNRRPNIVFTEGHDELNKEETADLEQTLRAFYSTGRINLDSIIEIPYRDTNNRVDILAIAKPRKAFTDQQKFQLDQYIMQGGKVIWMLDRLNADLTTMQQTGQMLPTDAPLNLEDQLFKYGVRVLPNLVLDMTCARIPLKVGSVGGAPQLDLFQWYYYPLVAPASVHPIVKSLDRVWLQFPSTVEVIKTKTDVQKTILLASSKYSRTQFTPINLNFEILRYPADPSKFNQGNQPLAVMLEGTFPSFFENTVSQNQKEVLERLGTQFYPLSKNTKMLVIGDGDIARNEYDARQGAMLPLGYNRFENYKFANKDFLLNAVEYMLDDKGIIEARGKDIKLRLLDTETAKANVTGIRLANILLPLALVGLFGAFFLWRRKKLYAQ
jgi:ABC-2 type transport system permease protein